MRPTAIGYWLLAIGSMAGGCHRAPVTVAATPLATGTGALNTLSASEQAGGWRLLFDGRTLAGWRGYKSADVPAGWSVVNGILTKTGGSEDLVTKDKYANFELEWDWMLPPGGNAGVFYRGTEEYDHIYWSAPEYQLLDDARHPDGHSRLTSAGAAYGLYPSPAGFVKPANEWNHSRIVVNGAHVQHWLNGTRVVDYELWSPDWQARVKNSKFAAYPNYGMARSGYIGLQGDHDGTLQLRNIKLRVLP